MVLEDSFVADYMSLCEADRATVRVVVGGYVEGWKRLIMRIV